MFVVAYVDNSVCVCMRVALCALAVCLYGYTCTCTCGQSTTVQDNRQPSAISAHFIGMAERNYACTNYLKVIEGYYMRNNNEIVCH